MNESCPSPDDTAIRTGSAPIEVTCPAWCEVSAAEHVQRLWENEGRCVHRTAVTVADPRGKRVWQEQTLSYCAPIELVLLMTTSPAGHEVESADVLVNGEESNLEQLQLVADVIADLAALYRVTPGRS